MYDVDPFETRLRFGSMVRTAGEMYQSIQQAAEFAIRHTSLIDHLYDCVSEQLEQSSITARLNILYLIDAILKLSRKSDHKEWLGHFEKDIVCVVTKVIPNNADGNTNLNNTRKVVTSWRKKGMFPDKTLDELDKLFQGRDIIPEPTTSELDKGDILKRMENDRNQHKSQKEDMWLRSTNEPENAEFEEYWENVSEMGEEDWEEIMESLEEYQRDQRAGRPTA